KTLERLDRSRVERHILDVSAYLKDCITERWGIAALYSPKDDERLRSGITAFNPFRDPRAGLNEEKFATFVGLLEQAYGIVVRYTRFNVAGSPAAQHAIRIC